MSQINLRPPRHATKALSRLLNQPLAELPLLTSFKSEDLPRLKEQVNSYISSLKNEDKLFTQLKVPIKKKYLEKLENDHELHQNMFLFLLRYLNSMENLNETQKIYIIALEVTDFADPMALKYEFMPGLENIYEKVSDLDPFDLLAYVIRVDSRWIIEVINLKGQKVWLVDFINPALSHLQSNFMHFLIDRVHFEFFKDHLPEKFEFLEKFIVRDLNDYGLYAGFMIYKLIINEYNNKDDISKIFNDINETTMKGFEEKIIWLIYSIILKNVKETNKEAPLKSTIIYKKSSSNFNDNKYYFRKGDSLPLKEKDTVSFSSKMLKDLLKQTKDEILDEISVKRNITNADQFIDEELENKESLKLTKQEFKELLEKYKQKFQNIRQKQAYDEQEKSMRFIQNYSSFSYLLWYYYNNDQETYKKLLDEYYKRLNNHLLTNLGLPPLIPEEEKQENIPEPPPQKQEHLTQKERIKPKKPYVPQYNVFLEENNNNDTTFDQNNDRKEINLNNTDNNNSKQSSINIIKGKSRKGISSENMSIVRTEPDESLEKYKVQPNLKSMRTTQNYQNSNINQRGQIKIPSIIKNIGGHRKNKSNQTNNLIVGLSNDKFLPWEDRHNKSNIMPYKINFNDKSSNNLIPLTSVSINKIKSPLPPENNSATAPVSFNQLQNLLFPEKKTSRMPGYKFSSPMVNNGANNDNNNNKIKLPKILQMNIPNTHNKM